MKKLVTHLLIGCALFSVAALGFGVAADVANAQSGPDDGTRGGDQQVQEDDQTDNPASFFGSQTIYNVLWTFVNNTFGIFVYLFGNLLDATVEHLIIGFSERFIDQTGFVVEELWSIIRDLFNIGFIFGLVYLGFTMILKNDDTSTRRWLVSLILAALLVNFSLFITKFIVDFSNILAAQIVQNGFVPPADSPRSISGTFMNSLGLTSVFDGAWINEGPFTAGSYAGAFGLIFGAMILFIVTAFVFAAGAVMIIIRFVALNLYMALSPLMFLGWVFPQLQDVSRKYWRGFLGRAFFAPIYMLLLYFAAYVMTAFRTDYQGNFSSLLTGNASANSASIAIDITNTLMPYAITIGFLIAAVVVANRMGADGASTTVNMMQNARNRSQRWIQQRAMGVGRGAYRGAVGTGRFAARNTLGYGARGVAARAEKGRLATERMAARMGQSDSAIQRWAGRAVDDTLGAGLRRTEKASVAGSETLAERRERVAKHQQKFNQNYEAQKRSNTLSEERKNAAAADTSTKEGREARQNALSAIRRQVQKMTKDELLDLGFDTLNTPEIAASLTDAQMKDLRESGRFTREQMGTLNGTRNDGATQEAERVLDETAQSAEELNDALDELGRTVRNLSSERLQDMGIEKLQDERIAMHLTQPQLDKLRDSGKFSAQEIRSIEAARDRGIMAVADGSYVAKDKDGNPTMDIVNQGVFEQLDKDPDVNLDNDLIHKRRQDLFNQSADKVGQLPVDAFARIENAQYLTPQALQQRMRNGRVSEENRSLIEENIQKFINGEAGYESTPEAIRQRAAKMWVQWTNRTTEGSNFTFTNPYASDA